MTTRVYRHSSIIGQVTPGFTWAAVFLLTFAGQLGSTNASDPSHSRFLQRHLDSIGSPESLADVRFRIAEGICKGTGDVLKQQGDGSVSIYGNAEFSAGPDSLRFTIQCDSPRYSDGFFFDRERVRVAVFGRQEQGWIGEFLADCSEYVKGGLIGGVLSTIWPLLEPTAAQQMLKSKGQEELDGRKFLAFDYFQGEAESVVLYFDPETYRHVATKCTAEIVGSYWTLMEEFSDIRTFDGLNLPTRWTLTLHAPRETIVWSVRLEKITHTEGPTLKRPVAPAQ